MAVLVSSLVPSLRRATSPPGVDLHPDASNAIMSGYVEDALWKAVLKGAISGYGIDPGGSPPTTDAIVPIAPNTTDLPPELGQLIVEFGAVIVIIGDLMNLQTTVRAVAGPVSFEVQRSATVLNAVLKSLQSDIALSLIQIGKYSFVNTTAFDAVIERTIAIAYNQEWFVR